MIILEFLRGGGRFIMSRSSGKVANWSTEVRPCVDELLSRFWEILARNKIISRKVRVNIQSLQVETPCSLKLGIYSTLKARAPRHSEMSLPAKGYI